MLMGLHPLLTGDVLRELDALGHGDSIVIADANFPARRVGRRLLDLAGHSAPAVTEAVRTVLPLDAEVAIALMSTPDLSVLPVQSELVAAALSAPDIAPAYLERFAFYAAAESAQLIIRTGEQRPYGNLILTKGVVTG